LLIAAKKGKLRIHFNKYDKLVEDEITSTIFGPLRYLSAAEVWDLFEALIKPNLEKKEFWPNPKENLNVEFNFWPTLLKYEDEEREPDIIIRFQNGKDLLLNLVLEVKWGERSRQSSEQKSTGAPSQLAEQWRQISVKERRCSLHIYLGWDKGKIAREFDHMFDTENGLNFRELKFSQKAWQERLVSITWGEMTHMIQSMKRWPYKSSIHYWLEEVIEFLDQFGFFKFTGFKDIATFNVPFMRQKILFWRHFDGFNICDDIKVGDCNEKSVIFYSKV
jgi:hypothetical protein